MSTIRTFIGIRISEEARSTLRDVQSRFREITSDVRWEDVSKFHITMKFLGETHTDRIPEILKVLEAIANRTPPCRLVLNGLGCFPDKRRPRIFWAGCDNPDGRLIVVRKELETLLRELGYEEDRNAFHPHITLGRCRDGNPPRELISLLETVTFDPVSFVIDDIVLMKSILKPGGSEYSVLQSIHLAG